MKKMLLSFLAAATTMFAAEAATVRATEKPPVIDGKLDDDCWKNALKFDQFQILNSSTPSALKTEAFLTYDNSAIYVGMKCYRPANGKIRLLPDKDSYSNDHVEVMVDPNFSQMRYFHYLLGVNNDLYDAARTEGGFVGDNKWESGATTATHIEDGYWTAELKIPYFSMDINPAGNTWSFNFCRCEWEAPNQEECSIAKSGNFHSAADFVPVNGIDIPLDKYAWQLSIPKVEIFPDEDKYKANISIPVTNSSETKQDILIDVIMNGKELGITGKTLRETFGPREQRMVEFRDIKLNSAGKYQMLVDLQAPQNRLLYKRRFYPVTVTFSPLTITLSKPWYRNAIFASQNLKQVEYVVDSKLDTQATIKTGIRTLDGKVICEKSVQGKSTITFPVSQLPEGKLQIFAESNGDTVTEPLRKLPFRKGETWRDEHGIWHIEKEAFFPVFNWGSAPVKGTNAAVHGDGKNMNIKRVDGGLMWSGTPTQHLLRAQRITPEDEQIIRQQVRKIDGYGDNLFAYYLCDEPEISGCRADVLAHFASIMRDEDPYHPILISNDTVSGAQDFLKCAEINGLHPYPNPAKGVDRPDFARIVTFVTQAVATSKAHNNAQTITFLQQSFNYGDCGSGNSRIPTYDEIRTQLLLSFTLGGNGVEFFNFTNMHYPELHIGLPDIAQEFSDVLTPAMTSPDIEGATTSTPNVAVRVKKVGNEYWIFASGLTTKKEEADITIPNLGNRKLYVLREGYSVVPKNNVFHDSFTNFDSRVYTTDARDFGKRPVAQIAAEIDSLNNARRKPGNLAFQMFEDDSIKLTSNSNAWAGRTNYATLWHVTDGITAGPTTRSPQGGEGFMPYASKNNGIPAWIALDFQKEITAGRIAVYGAEQSLADYEVQLLVNGQWKTVGSIKDSPKDFAEFTFAPQKTTAVRVYVTKVNTIKKWNYNQARIHEIEVYEK